MTAKHTSTRETILLRTPNPSRKILFPNPTPTRPRKKQTRWRNESWKTTQSSTQKIRSHYWHTIPPAGRAMMNPVRMIFCCSGVSSRRNNGTSLQIFRDLIGGAVAEVVRVPVVRIENPSNSNSSSSSRTKIRIRLHRNWWGLRSFQRERLNKWGWLFFTFRGVVSKSLLINYTSSMYMYVCM